MEYWFNPKWFTFGIFDSFHWVNPEYLYAIPFIPLLFWLRKGFHKSRKQHLMLSHPTATGWMYWTVAFRYLQPTFVVLGITMILVALARPQLVSEKRNRYSEGIDLMLLMDVSDSMTEKDLIPNRLEAAKNVAREFINGRLQDRIGLIVFAGEAVLLCPLTTDYQLLFGFLEDIKTNMVPIAGTAIGNALAAAVNHMRDADGVGKVAILISDGDNTSGSLGPSTAAQLAKAFGIKLYTISVGVPKRRLLTDTLHVTSSANVDEGELQKIAMIGDGKYFRATDNGKLNAVFQEINMLEKTKTKDVVSRSVEDFYRIYLNWGVAFLLLALSTKVTFMANILED